jgi:hypothetical protein
LCLSVEIMEIYRISAAFDEFLNLQLRPSSLKFKGNIELQAIWSSLKNSKTQNVTFKKKYHSSLSLCLTPTGCDVKRHFRSISVILGKFAAVSEEKWHFPPNPVIETQGEWRVIFFLESDILCFRILQRTSNSLQLNIAFKF